MGTIVVLFAVSIAGAVVLTFAEAWRRRSRTPEGGWRGLVVIDGQALRNSPALQHATPRLLRMLPGPHLEATPDIKVWGMLYIGAGDVTFRPNKGRMAPWVEPFTLTRQHIQQLNVHGDLLYVHLHGEPNPIVVKVSKPAGLADVTGRF